MFFAYLPALFLAFSGLAVGYILWYRDARHDDATRKKLVEQNSEMKQALTAAKTSYNALDERFTRQRGQLGVLQQLCDDWSASREQAEKERVQLEVQLTERTRRIEEMTGEMQATREKSIELEDSLHALTQQQLESISSLEAQWRQKTSLTENALVQQQSEVKTLASDRDRQLKKLHQAEVRVAELESELRSNANTLQLAKKNASGLEKEHVSLETALQHSQEQLKKSEGQCAAERSEKESIREQLVASQTRCQSLEQQTEDLHAQNADLETFKQKSESLMLSLSNANGQLEKVLSQRDSALDTCSTFQANVNGLQARLENQEASIHRLRKCQDDALENLKHELKVRNEMGAKYDSRLAELRRAMETQKAEYETKLTELAEAQGKQKAEYETKQVELVKAQGKQKAEYETKLAELVKAQGKQKAEYETKLAELVEAQGKQKADFDTEVEMLHEVAENELIGLKKQLESANAKVTVFENSQQKERVKLKEFEDLRLQLAQRETQLKELSNSLKSSSTNYQQQVVKLDTQRAQLAIDLQAARVELQSQLKQDSETIGQLQGERNELRIEVDRLHGKISELQQAIVEQERSHQQTVADAAVLKETQHRASQLEKELLRKEDTLKHLQAESSELARLRDDHARALDRQVELQTQLDAMIADHLTEASLQGRIDEQEQTIAELRDQIAQSGSRIASEPDPTVISFTQAIQQRNESAFDPAYGGRVRRDAARGVVFTEAPESRDDLKRISGIATVLEARLNEIGVYTFKQIMEWQPEEIEEFSRLLAFRDRIERDDWQGQARFFYSQKQEKADRVA